MNKKLRKTLVSMIILAAGMLLQTSLTASAAVTATNKDAKLYATETNFKASLAYKNYSDFATNLIFDRSVIVPGLKNTNVAGTNVTTMCPQGVCIAGNYMLISAYDRNDAAKSVIYVMKLSADRKTHTYMTTIVLPEAKHVGGMAYDGTNIWVSWGTSALSFKYSIIITAGTSSYYSLKSGDYSTSPVKTQASFMTYYKGKLWVGECVQSTSGEGEMYSYTISNKSSSSPDLSNDIAASIAAKTKPKDTRMTVPNRAQGIAFLSDGTMVVSRSLRADINASDYISELTYYHPSWDKPTDKGFVYKNNNTGKVTMPPMAEGIVIDGSYTYVLFESAAYPSINKPSDKPSESITYGVDRVMSFLTSNIKK